MNRWREVMVWVRFPVLALAAGGLLAFAGQWLRFSPLLPVMVFALLIAGAAELLIRLYRLETRAAGPRRARRLLALRLTALAMVAWILLEPTWVRKVRRDQDREVVVLWDESASMKLRDDGAADTRAALARAAVAESGILKQLGERLKVREMAFARGAESGDGVRDSGWTQATDIAAALDTVLEQVAPDRLAGAILVTDGRHNRPSRVEDGARRFGVLDAPLGILAVGNPEPPKDAAVLSVSSPDAIHLGDRMRVTADLKFDGFKGTKAKVTLSRNKETIEEREILIPDDRHREEVRFTHIPDQGGTDGYQINIADLPDERFYDNNSWSFETSITEARTHVLLIDSHPRWEFRYLRNLFHGRDKSVHLQWVLLHPDTVDGQSPPDIAASASRPFGESAASRLPDSEAEWRKFDVIILGDLAPEAISAAEWEIVRRCVSERGAMLVFVAGPQSMPHALPAGPARDLLPVEVEWGHRTYFGEGGDPFRLSLTAEGRSHPVTRNGITGGIEWGNLPVIGWRHPVTSVKEGAEVLLTAATDGNATVVADDASLGGALTGLAERRAREAKAAVLVSRQTGHGKVACLLTDRTWRLREGAGDTHHHRFWSSLVRWGAGPQLRGGTPQAGIGTDQLTYTVDDPVYLTARLRDASLNPVFDPSLRAEIIRDGQPVATVSLAPVTDSNGLHEGSAGKMRVAGNYQVKITGDRLAQLNAASGVETRFRVIGTRGPVELADTTPDRALLTEAAAASGGKLVELAGVSSLAPLFLTDKEAREEIRETPLWDNPLVFLLLAAALTAEWWFRRSAGLP